MESSREIHFMQTPSFFLQSEYSKMNFCEIRKSMWTPGVKRLFIILLVLAIIVLPMMAMQVVIDNRSFEISNQRTSVKRIFYEGTPLYDEILDNIPHLKWKMFGVLDMQDVVLNTFIVFSIVFFVFQPISRSDRTLLLRRAITLIAIAYGLRILTLAFTRVPASVPKCNLGKGFKGIGFLKRMFNISETCSDMIYSGHTSVAFILLYIWLSLRTPIYFKLYAVVNVLAALSMFFLYRLHYTVDIILGFYMASLLTIIYSLALHKIEADDLNCSKSLKEPFLIKVVRWIELRPVTLQEDIEMQEIK